MTHQTQMAHVRVIDQTTFHHIPAEKPLKGTERKNNAEPYRQSTPDMLTDKKP